MCINCNDRDRLLEASKWPANVIIYDYFFKSKNETSAKTPAITAITAITGYNGNTGNTTTTTESSAGSSLVVTQHGAKPVAEINDSDIIEQAEEHNEDMDSTILESYTDESTVNCNMATKQNINHGAT